MATNEGDFMKFARSYQRYGVFVNGDGDIEYREWAPAAKGLSLVNITITILTLCVDSSEISMGGTVTLTSAQRTISGLGLW